MSGGNPEKNPVHIVQEDGWASWPVSTGTENLAPNGIWSMDSPFRSESLYRLHYCGRRFYVCMYSAFSYALNWGNIDRVFFRQSYRASWYCQSFITNWRTRELL